MVNFAQYVYKPHTLQDWDYGKGFRDLAEARRDQQRVDISRGQLDEQRAQRGDTNSYNAATFARDRSNNEYEAAKAKYQARLEAVEKARAAAQANDQARVAALIPTIQELGGTANMDASGNPLFEAGQAPTHGPMDIQGMRGEIYGGGAPKMGQPFQMPSPSPGGPGGPGGSLYSERNPFDSPATPGASAAAAGPMPGAAPPQDPQPELLGGPPLEEQPQASTAQPQLTGPNPLNPPTFSPYRIDMDAARARNRRQVEPILEGIDAAAPPSTIGIGKLNAGIMEAGLAPAAAMDLQQKSLDSLIKIYNGQQAAAAASGRLDQSRSNAETAREDKLRKEAQTKSYRIIQNDDLKKVKTKLMAAKDAASMADQAVYNPQIANALVTKLYNMNEDGLITNTDFTRTASGMQSLAEAVKNHALNVLLLGPTGINPSMAANIKALIDKATQNQQRTMKAAADKMYQMYKSAGTEGERNEYEDGFRMFFPTEFYPPEMAEPWQGDVPPGALETASPPPAGDNLGRVPLPKTPGASPKVSPSGTKFEPGRLGPKPPRKPQKPPTQEELDNASEEELMQMLKNAGDQ